MRVREKNRNRESFQFAGFFLCEGGAESAKDPVQSPFLQELIPIFGLYSTKNNVRIYYEHLEIYTKEYHQSVEDQDGGLAPNIRHMDTLTTDKGGNDVASMDYKSMKERAYKHRVTFVRGRDCVGCRERRLPLCGSEEVQSALHSREIRQRRQARARKTMLLD
ncbi:unnamed protein product [Cuscuta campestris]|uniref:Uncharacterized protein n=1 Tax=Cuscuta campestris TaxID=132261 RepID=A0A484KJF2_9ASTE|nr:unnamed protein product [Cuscuta campestris]